MFGSMLLKSGASKALGLLKSKKTWLVLIVIISVITLGGAFWYMQYRIEDLTGELADTETQIAQLSADNEALHQTVDKVEQRMQQLRAARKRLDQVRSQLQTQLSNVQSQLDDINIEDSLQKKPEQTIKQMKGVINEQLECLEKASGDGEASCDSLQPSSQQ